MLGPTVLAVAARISSGDTSLPSVLLEDNMLGWKTVPWTTTIICRSFEQSGIVGSISMLYFLSVFLKL